MRTRVGLICARSATRRRNLSSGGVRLSPPRLGTFIRVSTKVVMLFTPLLLTTLAKRRPQNMREDIIKLWEERSRQSRNPGITWEPKWRCVWSSTVALLSAVLPFLCVYSICIAPWIERMEQEGKGKELDVSNKKSGTGRWPSGLNCTLLVLMRLSRFATCPALC